MGVRTIVRLLLVLAVIATSMWAQQDRGTFTGTVTDPSGAAVPGAKITIQNVETGALYASESNEAGQYRVPNLPVGTYKLTFELQGFKSLVRDNIPLSVSQVARMDATLQVGSATESIEVTAEVSALQTETPEVGTLLDNKNIVNLPLGFSGGRAVDSFAFRVTPGVGGNSYMSRINGSASFSKEVILDGASGTIYIGGQIGESSPSLEAVEEFKIQTSGMSAEFGRTGGGVFNFVMKSGTNQFHGSAVGNIHNEWADANTFSNNFYGNPKRMDRRHNWALSGGGPIVLPKIYNGKDKTFVYAAYERYKEAYGGSGSPSVTVPLPEWFQGDMSRYLTNEVLGTDALGRSVLRGQIYDPTTTRTVNGAVVRDPFPGNKIPQSLISPIAKNLGTIFQQHYMPQVKDPATGQFALLNNAFFPVSNQAGFTQNQFSVKVDHNLSERHKVNGSFVYVDRPRYLVDQGGVWDFNATQGGPLSRSRLQHVRSWYGRFSYDWTISPTLLNHLQAGFNRQRNPSTSAHMNENGAAALGIAGLTRDYNYPEINLGSNDRVNFPTLGYQSNDLLAGQNYMLIDNLSWIKGKHAIRMGVDFRRTYMRSWNNAGPGAFNFSSSVTGLPNFNQTGHGFASMLLGDVSSASVQMNVGVGSRYDAWALFLQDDYKVARNLTLNLGVRWDYQPLPVEQYDRYGNFNPNLIDPISGLPGALEFAGTGPGLAGVRNFGSNKYNNFSPRIGFAYSMGEKTTIRGGYGIFFLGRNPNGWSGVPWGQTMGFQQFNEVQQPTLAYNPAFNWANGYTGVVQDRPRNPSLAADPYNSWGPVSWDPDAGRVGYAQQWNFNIQRNVGYGFVVDLGYVGSKSTGIQANEQRRLYQMNPKYLALGDRLTQEVSSQSQASAISADARYPFGTSGRAVQMWQTLTPFPQLATWNVINSAFSPLGFSTYHALQVQVNRQVRSDLTIISNYTWSKSIDNVNSAFGDTWGMNSGRPLDYYNRALDKSISDADRPHVFKIAASYNLPYGKGRKFGSNSNIAMNFALGGWTLNYIGNYSSGAPMGLGATGLAVGNFATNRAVLVNANNNGFNLNYGGTFDMSRINIPGTASNTVFDTSLVRNTGRYELGNTPYRYGQLRLPWELNDDLSLQKYFFPLKSERVRIQIRAEFLNAFNRHRFNAVNTDVSSPLFGQITGVSDDRRQVQFGIRGEW